MINIKSSMHARKYIGRKFHWEEHSNRYVFPRTGILTQVTRGKLSFNDSYDFKSPSDYTNLTVEGEEID